MPGYNQTGPMAEGPMPGRGMGFCNCANQNFDGQISGAWGGRRERIQQRGRQRTWVAHMDGFDRQRVSRTRSSGTGGIMPKDRTGEIEMLKAQAESMKSTLEAICERVKELEKVND